MIVAMIPLDQLEKLLHHHRLRLTHPRRIVFEFFALAQEPIQLAGVIEALRPLIDRASIYRTIQLYQRLGVIYEVQRPGRLWLELGESFAQHHHHLTCTGCGLSQTLSSPRLEQILAELAEQAGFKPTRHHLEMSGLCVDCLAARRNQ